MVKRRLWRQWLGGLLVCGVASVATAKGSDVPDFAFKGHMLVIASDGDMRASAYADGRLGQPAPDTLSIVRLDRLRAGMHVDTVAVPNSVIGPPASVAVTPDGRYAVVVETWGARPADKPDALMSDLPPGRAVTVIDLGNGEAPAVVQRIDGPDSPLSVSFGERGRLVAIAYDTTKSTSPPLVIYRFVDGRLVDRQTPAIPGFSAGDALKNVAFDEPMNALALVYATRPRLTFLKVGSEDRRFQLRRWGNDVALGRTPFMVQFTPDGRFALVNDMFVPTQGSDVRGSVSSIAIALHRAPDGTPRHVLVSQARTGVMPEGMAISPDGHWVVTANLERTAYPFDDPHQGFFASVTLLRLEPQTGWLSRVDDFPFAGVLPEAAAFDNTSHFLAVTSFEQPGPAGKDGSVAFWRIVGDFQDPTRTGLAPTGFSMPIARGAQSMAIVR